MQRTSAILVCGLIAWSVICNSPTWAEPPPKKGQLRNVPMAEKAMDVLDGRLTIRVPEGAQNRPRSHSIMAAPRAQTQETRVTFDVGPERLVLMAEETFALAGDDLEKDVQRWLAEEKDKYKIESLQNPAKGLEVVVVTPLVDPDHSRGKDAAFVEGIFVKSADRTIQSLEIFVNPAAEKDMEGCRTLVGKMLRGVAPGNRKLDLAAGERRLSALLDDVEISVNVRENTAMTTQIGPDFLVHHLIAMEPFGVESCRMGVYVGGHPGFKPGAKKDAGELFGKSVDWQSFGEGKGLQCLCELPTPGESGLKAHVWIRAATDAQLAAMKKVAEGMKLMKRQPN